jgi:tRNA G18 (ribose-2'-O)-methylase SpoU
MKLNAQELRTTPVDPDIAKNIQKHPISIILDNVLDTYNVGAIFRLADAIAADCVYLCGQTETPPNSKIKKASVSTWQWVNWKYEKTARDAIETIKKIQPDAQIIAVEQDERSIPWTEVSYQFPVAIIVGNETYGVSKEALDASDIIVELPMWGINTSLNVMVSCGIIAYDAMKQMKK